MAETWQMGNLDWERELTCSICTDIFYQPLALLDCLHTFCGSCLKEWFAQQASTATSIHPYTCPSCRAPVRSTTKHAWINTILEQYMKMNPDKGKTEQEKADIRKTYKPGESVMPKLRRRRRPDDDRDREVMDRVRELSLREAGVEQEPAPTLDAPRPRGSRSRSRSHDRRRHHRSRESSSSGVESLARPPRTTPSTLAGPPTARQVAHQSSLRSLLSASDLDSPDLEEALLRQVVEEGILDGIDLDHMSSLEEEQIQQAIYEAFRRLRRERASGRQTDARSSNTSLSNVERPPQTVRATTDSPAASTQSQSSRPPISRPHLFQAGSDNPRAHRRRTSSQGSSHSTRTDSQRALPLPSATGDRAARSASDLSLDPPRAEGSGHRPRRASANTRRTTDPVQPRSHERTQQSFAERRTNSNPATPHPTTSETRQPPVQQHATVPVVSSPSSTARDATTASAHISGPSSELDSSPVHEMAASTSNPARNRATLFYEPSTSCDRCGKPNIQYKVHFSCAKCNNGTFNICQQCYRKGEGCFHWYGATPETADAKFARLAPSLPPSQQVEPPHMLIEHRYKRPKQPPVRSSTDSARMMTDEDPSRRLEAGVFCDICSAFANDCYWRCDTCNDGAWGYCNGCTNQLRHCTHPLLPLTHRSAVGNKQPSPQPQATSGAEQNTLTIASPASPPLTPNSFSELASPDVVFTHTLAFYPYSFTTDCDICHKSIPPSQSRYHCPECNGGDYDICNACYPLQVTKGRVRKEDGPSGWRRCLNGHRMAVVGFEDRVGGQRRLVVAERVGGLALKDEGHATEGGGGGGNVARLQAAAANGMEWSWRDEDNTLRTRAHSISPNPSSAHLPLAEQQRYPPSGGVGLRILALFGWFPAEGATDELMFPKGAEITEAENINGDWFWGCYAGAKGLFPGNYGRVIRRVE